MHITQSREGTHLMLALEGRLDSTAAPSLKGALKPLYAEITKISLDMQKLEYISSAGLRVILFAQKQMDKQNGELIVMHANESVMEVFEITGFTDILTIV